MKREYEGDEEKGKKMIRTVENGDTLDEKEEGSAARTEMTVNRVGAREVRSRDAGSPECPCILPVPRCVLFCIRALC